jgi:hypothetical protein
MRIYINVFLCMIMGVCFTSITYAQSPELLKTIHIPGAKLFSVDELKNVYIVDGKNGIVKYNAEGDSIAYFQVLTHGPISSIDVTDPMRVLVYYANFFKIMLLDRMLAPINTIDLKTLNIQQPTAIATAKDGGFWVYDYMQVKLMKLDRRYNSVANSNDLRVQLQEVPKFEMMFEKDNELWAYDPEKGLYVFNRFGDFINKIVLQSNLPILSFQKEQEQLIYATQELITVYNLQNFTTKILNIEHLIGKKNKGVFINRDYFYVLNKEGLSIYSASY